MLEGLSQLSQGLQHPKLIGLIQRKEDDIVALPNLVEYEELVMLMDEEDAEDDMEEEMDGMEDEDEMMMMEMMEMMEDEEDEEEVSYTPANE